MRDRDYTISVDFLNRFFGDAEGVVELRACANERGGAQSLFTRDPAEIASFARRKDVPGTGTYFGIATRRKGTTSGGKQDVCQVPALWVDIDCAKQGIKGADALAALNFLPFPPTIIVNSGGGLHAYWMLETCVDVSERYADVEQLCRKLALILAGDMSCAEIARILRLPGTDNSKEATRALNDGEPATCEIISDTGAVYDLDTLAEWLTAQRAVLHGHQPASIKPVQEDDPFLIYARAAGYEPSIDVEAELAAMADGNIHQTQLRVSMSLIARGYDDDEIVSMVLAATEQAAPGNASWNWDREERAIRKMVTSGRAKAVDRDEKKPQRANSVPMAANDGNAARKLELVHDAEPKARVKQEIGSKSQTVAVGKAAIGVWNDRHGPVMHTDGTTYAYEAGVWVEWDDRLAQRLRAIIQEACASLKIEPKTSLLNAAKAYFMDRPELVRHDVEFDVHGLIITEDSTIDPATGTLGDHSPEHFAKFKVGASGRRHRNCPAWLKFLAETFADKPQAEAEMIVSTLQEFFGAALVAAKPRSMKLGLLAHGDSRTGKTQIAQVMRALLGMRHVSGARMRDLEGRFGMEPFLGKRGWIADDAIGEGEYLDADTYKVVVTGEETSVQCKGGRNVETHFGFPVMLTANNLPRVKDQSDAVYNRSLILPCTNVRPRTAPEPLGYNSIAEKVVAEDLDGLLWWAFEGWKRLSARGFYDPPKTMIEAAKSFEAGNNPVGTWKDECVEDCPDMKVSRADLLASMNGWWAQEYGVDAKPWSGRGFFPRLTQAIPGWSKDRENTDGDGTRYVVGLMLNKAGMLAWSTFKSGRWGEGSKTSAEEAFVNRSHAYFAPAPPSSKSPRF